MSATKTQRTTRATLVEPSYDPPVYDPLKGQKELERLGPELDVISEGELATPRIDVEAATYAALGVAGFVGSPLVRGRFRALPREEIAMADVDGLGPACFATLYALAEARAAGALETEARIPVAVIAEASEVEQRMQRLCEYHLSDDPEIGPELDRLRPGVGHRDLANDLLGYARIYDLRPAVVESDPKHYQPGDAARAREIGGVIIQALSAAMTPRARRAYDRYVRVWTLLNRRYDEVRATGLWLFRKDAGAAQRFPSLFTASRPTVGRKKRGKGEATETVTTPAPATASAPANGAGGAAGGAVEEHKAPVA